MSLTSASAGLEDANPTIRPEATPLPAIPSATATHFGVKVLRQGEMAYSGSNAAAPVTPREPKFTKGEKTCPDNWPTCMQNFTPLSFSAAEKPVTVRTNKTRMWANAQRDGHPAEYQWRPLVNAVVWLTSTTRVPCINAADI